MIVRKFVAPINAWLPMVWTVDGIVNSRTVVFPLNMYGNMRGVVDGSDTYRPPDTPPNGLLPKKGICTADAMRRTSSAEQI